MKVEVLLAWDLQRKQPRVEVQTPSLVTSLHGKVGHHAVVHAAEVVRQECAACAMNAVGKIVVALFWRRNRVAHSCVTSATVM